MKNFIHSTPFHRLMLVFLLCLSSSNLQCQTLENLVDQIFGGTFSEAQRHLRSSITTLKKRLEADSSNYVANKKRLEFAIEGLNQNIVICSTKVEILNGDIQGHLNTIATNERKIGRLQVEKETLTEKLDTCNGRLGDCIQAKAREVYLKDSIAGILVATRDTLGETKAQLSRTEAECATESFRIVGNYKSWGRKYQVTLNRPNGGSKNPHPRNLETVTVEFNTCNSDYSAVVKCDLGGKTVKGENINSGKYIGVINRLKNRGKNWYEKGKSYQFVINESSHGEKEMQILNKHLQANASIRF